MGFIATTITASEVIAALLLLRIWRTRGSLLSKLGWTIFVCLPLLGPFFYMWLMSWPSVQTPELQNRDALGFYFNWRLSKRRDLDKYNKV